MVNSCVYLFVFMLWFGGAVTFHQSGENIGRSLGWPLAAGAAAADLILSLEKQKED